MDEVGTRWDGSGHGRSEEELSSGFRSKQVCFKDA